MRILDCGLRNQEEEVSQFNMRHRFQAIPCYLTLAGFALALALTVRAQEDPQPATEEPKPARERFKLLTEDPFDQITLKDGSVVQIVPQQFPEGTKPANPKPTDKLRIKLLTEVGELFDVTWENIQRYDQFQDLILEDAKALTALGQYDLAWDHFIFLREHYPQTPGLSEAATGLVAIMAPQAIPLANALASVMMSGSMDAC